MSCLRIELSELQHSPRAAQGSAFPLHPLLIHCSFRCEPSFLDSLLLLATNAALRCCRNRPDSSRNVKDGFEVPRRHQGMRKDVITIFREVDSFCQQTIIISSSLPQRSVDMQRALKTLLYSPLEPLVPLNATGQSQSDPHCTPPSDLEVAGSGGRHTYYMKLDLVAILPRTQRPLISGIYIH